jgi:polyisoprenoid-binding protein YceI
MRYRDGMLLWTAVAFAAPLLLQAGDSGGVGFRGESAAGPVVGRLGSFSATLDLEAGSGRFEADPTTLSTGFGPRDQRLLVHALETATFPELRFEVARIDTEGDATASSRVLTLHGTLLLHGVSAPLSVQATLEREGDRLRVRGEFPLTLADFGIPDPSVLVARYASSVTVTFDLTGAP